MAGLQLGLSRQSLACPDSELAKRALHRVSASLGFIWAHSSLFHTEVGHLGFLYSTTYDLDKCQCLSFFIGKVDTSVTPTNSMGSFQES